MNNKPSPLEVLQAKFQENNLKVREDFQEKLAGYISLLQKWNTVHNLTNIHELTDIVDRHIIESINLAPFFEKNASVVDVGTGAGLPGIPLAIVRPDLKVLLVDSIQKKINFVEHVIFVLKLKNCEAMSQRVEAYRPNKTFDIIISRAFAAVPEFLNLAGHLGHESSLFIAMTGKLGSEEYIHLPLGYRLQKILPQPLSATESSPGRNLVFIEKNQEF